MFLLVGLGNPGAQYAKNRHNIGFMLVDRLIDRANFGPEKKRFSALTYDGTLETPKGVQKILAMKPQTFMNLSGHAVQEAMQFFKIKPEQVMVFHDELDLAAGRFRYKLGGGNAGHNGLKSITQQVGPNFGRGRMGIGHPGDKGLVHSYVLSDFAKSEGPWVTAMIDACIDALPILLDGDRERYQNEVMRLAPAPKIDPISNKPSL